MQHCPTNYAYNRVSFAAIYLVLLICPTSTVASAMTNAATSQAALAVTAPLLPIQGDYIPCKFTPTQLRSLVAPQVAPTLSPADAESMQQQVITAALTQSNDPSLTGSYLNEFIKSVAADSFASLTPSQALNKVIQKLSDGRKAVLSPVTASNLDDLGSEMKEVVPTGANESTKTGIETFNKAVNDFVNYLKNDNEIGLITNNDLTEAAQKAAVGWASETPKGMSTMSISDKEAVLPQLQAKIPGPKLPDNDSIIDAARNSLAYFDRPPDVGCAMSILDWKETDMAFGHMIANEYIAVQVVVRNLNREQAFLLHDVEFEVDTDPAGNSARFISGRDKVIVRALSSEQSSFSPRAIYVHSAEAVGAILSAAVPVFAGVQTLANATAVFNGALVPGLDKYWKDVSGDQLNLLNDTGFSSQSNSQTTVPQLATAMFVTFIPSKQFDEAWWTQPCVEKTYLGTKPVPSSAQTLTLQSLNSTIQPTAANASPSAPSLGTFTADVQVLRALETCTNKLPSTAPRSRRHWYTAGYRRGDNRTEVYPNPAPKDSAGENSGADYFRNAYERTYKNWSGTSLQLFSQLSNVVVAGTHITEDSQLQPSLTSVTCKTDSTGNVLFPTPDTESISCILSGKNLNKVSQLRLRNAKDQTDTITAEGTVKVSGDSTTGTVDFPTAALHVLPQPAYTVFTVSSSGVEGKTGQQLHFLIDPLVISLAPSAGIDFSTGGTAPQVLAITGYHLGDVDTVELTATTGTKNNVSVKLLDAQRSATQLTVPIDPVALSLATTFGTSKVTLNITLEVNKKPFKATQTLDLTAPPKTAANKPATKPRVKDSGLSALGQFKSTPAIGL